MKYFYSKFSLCIFILIFSFSRANSQIVACPTINAGPDVNLSCGNNCTTLHAAYTNVGSTTSYSVAPIGYTPIAPYNAGSPIIIGIDDRWSAVLPLPFPFCFFGTTYSSVVAGSNGIITFNTAAAAGFCNWSLSVPLPTTGYGVGTYPAIMGPYQDIDPTFQGLIAWEVIDAAPCRKFVCNFYQVPYFGDPNSVSTAWCGSPLYATSQIVLYETTNVIDIYIASKPTCTAWNAGLAIEGIQNEFGTVAYTVPGRNCTVFTAFNDAYRFTPNALPWQVSLAWFDPLGNFISSADSITVCPATASTYTLNAHYGNCPAATTVDVSDQVTVTPSGSLQSALQSQQNISCFGGNNGSASVVVNVGSPPYTFAWSPTGGTAATASNLTAGTYTCSVTNPSGCVNIIPVTITQPPILTTANSPPTNVSCYNGSNGQVITTAGGGTPAYTYQWSPSGGTGATASSLSIGMYTVTVTDSYGCSTTATSTITQPTQITAAGATITNVSCFNGNNGSASVTPGGGTGTYTYLWNPSAATTQTASSLISGTYTATVTDANGCTATSTATITQPSVLLGPSSTLAHVACNGGANGSVRVNPSGGTGPYTFVWSPSAQTGQTATGLTSGTYTVTVTDSHGCTVSSTATVNQPNALAAPTSTLTNVGCNGGNNGSASVTASGGTGTYTYLWSPTGGNGQTATTLTAGAYTVTVTDANGCTITSTTTVTQPVALTAAGSTLTNVLCNSGNDGSVTVTPNNGTPGYTYLWSPTGGTGQTASNLVVGTYTVTVTDANGCTITATASVTQPSALAATSSTLTNALCAGGNEGSATVNPNNGSPGYTYQWSPAGGNSQTASNLIAGIYTITVSDANGCSITATTTITEPIVLTAAGSTLANISCNGGNDGSVNVTPSDGTPGYTYLWSPVGGTDASATGLTMGSYTVLITDANGCTTTATATVTEPTLLSAVGSTVTNVSCNTGSDGTATVNPSGGTGAYTYSWLPSGGMNQTATGLAAGTYTVVVADQNGCLTSTMTVITEPTAVTAGASTLANIACSSSAAGVAAATGGGGTGTYTYLWSPAGGTDATASSLTGGTYTVTVTDANGCTQTATTLVGQTNPVQISVPTTTNVSCNGGNNGQAISSVTGGAGPYSYNWSPSGGTDATASSLIAGNYTVTVTDANGCTEIAYTSISEPTLLTSSIPSSTNVLCSGGTDGSANVSANGGSGTYNYLWTPAGGTDVTASGLAAGDYTITVTDANSCTTISMVTITEPPLLTSVIGTSVNLTCYQNNSGSASVNPSGGTGAYTYSWLPSGGNGATASNLAAGTYTILVADVNGCVTATSTVLTEPSAITSFIDNSANVTCAGGNDGMASVLAGGGSNPYNYSWSSGGTNSVENGLLAGTYTVTVTDNNGCSTTTNVTITEPTPVTAAIGTSADASCNNATDGSATVVPGGGVGSYNYLWSTGGTGATENNLGAGTYTVTVTDGNNCFTTTTVTINQPALLVANIPLSTDVSCNGGGNGTAAANVIGGTGPYTYSWLPSGGTDVAASGLTAGNYTVGVADAHGCLTTAFVTITEPSPLSAPMGVTTDVSCNGGNNGSASVNPSGGAGSYNYFWSPSGGTDQAANNLAAGTYSVTVTDANGCTIVNTSTVTEPIALSLLINGATTICQQQSATITAVPGGGIGPYTYLWNNLDTSSVQTVAPTSTTNYSVIVTDANGCTITQSVDINVNPPLAVNAQSTAQICDGDAASVSAYNMSGGTGGPYTYSWSTGQTGVSFSDNPAVTTNYTVTISDGCSPDTFAITTVIVNPLPIVAFGPAGSSGCAPVSVDFTDSSITSVGSFYSWNMGDGTGSNQQAFSYIYTNPGTYNVVLTITSAEGCTSTSTPHPIAVYPVPNADFIAPAEWEIMEGVTPLQMNNLSTYSDTWFWDFGDGGTDSIFNPAHSYTDTGFYNIMLISTNSEGCIDTAYRLVYVTGEFVIYIPDAFTPNGDGTNDGFRAYGMYIKDYDMWILDRWGGKIFHSTDLNNPWDGTYFENKKLCQNGVYIYKIKAHDYQGKLHEFVGSVTLAR
jgi:gliding motility-associated-like protein